MDTREIIIYLCEENNSPCSEKKTMVRALYKKKPELEIYMLQMVVTILTAGCV